VSTKELILGLIKKCPTHGYQIKKYYQEFVNPDDSLNDAKLYPLLREMEAEGLITRETEDREVGPSRKVITLTDEGSRAYDEWLESDSSEGYTARPRYDYFRAFPFLVKYSFFYDLDGATALGKVERQAAMHRARLDDYRGARLKMLDKGLETCKIQSIDFGIMLEETIIRWLDEMAAYYRSEGGARKRGRRTPARKAK